MYGHAFRNKTFSFCPAKSKGQCTMLCKFEILVNRKHLCLQVCLQYCWAKTTVLRLVETFSDEKHDCQASSSECCSSSTIKMMIQTSSQRSAESDFFGIVLANTDTKNRDKINLETSKMWRRHKTLSDKEG